MSSCDAVSIDHGRIDLTEAVTAVRHHVLRIGALVTFELSAEDRFQEQAERWVDVPSRRLLPSGIAERLARAATDSGGVASDPGQLLPAIAEAHRLIDAAALARRETLAGEVNGAHQAERARAVAYYADAIAAIERRLATAPADRRAVLEERLRGTREEEARRLAEIAEKYAASHAIRPSRLHVIEVPALRLPTDVRRGDRRYPMTFDWLLPAGAFAPVLGMPRRCVLGTSVFSAPRTIRSTIVDYINGRWQAATMAPAWTGVLGGDWIAD